MLISGPEWLLIAAAIVLIVAVNYYFLGPRRASRATGTAVQEAVITVEGGYVPSVIDVDAGRPVRLIFDRRESNPCSDEVVFGSLGIRRALPAFARTAIEFTPATPGRIEFTCGMGMLHGAVVAR
jgi:P-type Cu+ transporter